MAAPIAAYEFKLIGWYLVPCRFSPHKFDKLLRER